MKRILQLVAIFIVFTLVIQLAVHLWLARPAPRFPVLAEKRFEVIAHRAGREFVPPSTLEAMHAALEAGTDVLEMDIHMSRDGHLVVIHDSTLDRTTNCSGKVLEKSLEELKSCDKGKPGFRIPTLRAVFRAFKGQRMIIEMKQEEPSLVKPFCSMIREFGMADKLIVGSFRQQPMDALRQVCPEVATSATPAEAILFILAGKMWLSRSITPVYAALQIPPRIPLPGFLPSFPVTTRSLVEQAHDKGLAVQVWTVNDVEEMKEMLNINVDGIMTDFPARLTGITHTQ